MLEVIKTAEKVTGRKPHLVIVPRRAGDPAVLVASSALIRRELGWKPQYAALETIVRTAWQ